MSEATRGNGEPGCRFAHPGYALRGKGLAGLPTPVTPAPDDSPSTLTSPAVRAG